MTVLLSTLKDYQLIASINVLISTSDLRTRKETGKDPVECIPLHEINSKLLEWRRKYPTILGYQETSAETNEGIEKCFENAVSIIHQQLQTLLYFKFLIYII